MQDKESYPSHINRGVATGQFVRLQDRQNIGHARLIITIDEMRQVEISAELYIRLTQFPVYSHLNEHHYTKW